MIFDICWIWIRLNFIFKISKEIKKIKGKKKHKEETINKNKKSKLSSLPNN